MTVATYVPSSNPGTLPDRFTSKYIVSTDGCWIWTASVDQKGYARLRIDGPMTSAHRYAYEQLVGPIPDGLQLDHLCRNRSCVNPAHLEPVTPRENVMRSLAPLLTGARNTARFAAMTHCYRGHEFTEENTYRGKRRTCLICRRESQRRWYLRKKAAA